MVEKLPWDVQHLICDYIFDSGNSKHRLSAMRVSKTWAYFICSRLYRNYQINDYLQFVGFVNTVSSPCKFLPYGKYVRVIDLATVNRYGIDTRVNKLIRHCPNLQSISLGHPSTVKPETIRLMAKYCKRLNILHMGGLESFPFLLECDFSGLRCLKEVTINTTPIDGAALNSLPPTIEKVRLVHLDSIDNAAIERFCTTHPRVQLFSLDQCRYLANEVTRVVASGKMPALKHLELAGSNVDDTTIESLLNSPSLILDAFRLCNTHVTDATIEALCADRLKVRHLDIAHNALITENAKKALLQTRKKKGTLMLLDSSML
ncbi:hypothetical protein BX666DRAFT_99389 [Dichotomocladium elegans]|nr:hypothetical protein BX666DRAFT_99389 [Dichotomocladium elegans]